MGAVADVQTYLAAQGLVDGSTDWPSVRRYMHDESDNLVVITEDGGFGPDIPAVSGLGDFASQDAGVQVRVRSSAHQSDAAYEEAKAILDELHGLLDTTLGSTAYQSIVARTPEPVFLGFHQSRPEFTVSFRLTSFVPA